MAPLLGLPLGFLGILRVTGRWVDVGRLLSWPPGLTAPICLLLLA